MFVIEERTRIEAPVQVVFSRLAHVAGYRDWLSGSFVHRACHATSGGAARLGTTYRDDTWFGSFHGEIIEFDAPRQIVFQQALHWAGVRIIEARQANTLLAEGGATALMHRFEGRLATGLRVAEPLVGLVVRAERRRILAALRDSVVAQPAAL